MKAQAIINKLIRPLPERASTIESDQQALFMSKQIPCTECGALILQQTAERTGGVCMACKQGIRKQIEASKLRHAESKEYDPHRALWTSFLYRVSSAPKERVGLSEDERHYFAVSLLEGEVFNGGFDQFFWNSAGDWYADAVAGLRTMGADESLGILTAAKTILFSGLAPPSSTELRRELLRKNNADAIAGRLQELDDRFCDHPDGLPERLKLFASERGLITPFLRE